MAAIRSRDTKPELVLRKLVHRLGYRYRLHGAKLPGKPDLVFAGRQKVIFLHGCYWHVHSCRYGAVVPKTNAEFWSEKRASNARRDAAATAALEASGWSVLVVWECELRDQVIVVERLRTFLDGS